jgi:hypothetical protein
MCRVDITGALSRKCSKPVIALIWRAAANRVGLQVSTGYPGIRFTAYES